MKKETFVELKKLVPLLSGDMVGQDELFEAQEILFTALLEGSSEVQKTDLCKSFPYIYYKG